MSRCPECGSKECCGAYFAPKLEAAEARVAELERLVPDLSRLTDEMDESGKTLMR